MLIIPAVDIIGGKVVRLKRGDFKRETIYGDNPVQTAKVWEDSGAEFIHVVDLDGAREGKPVNFDIISKLISGVNIPVEVGGGIRDRQTVTKYISLGAGMVILGTAALEKSTFLEQCLAKFGESIVVSLDSLGGKNAIEGWREITGKNVKETIEEMEKYGVKNIIYTDIESDGMLAGPDMKTINELSSLTKIPLTIAGGISSIEQIHKLKNSVRNIRGIIIGEALYSGRINLKEAIEAAKKA